jgi:Skp family chaperone for outer membrane proteins
VEAYAKELNLAVVVNATEDMLYASDVVDITTEIIRRVNADIVKNPAKTK